MVGKEYEWERHRMNPPKLDSKKAFLHVIYDHRYLAVSGCAWNFVGPKGTTKARRAADELLPEISTVILDSLLLHARSLIKFYSGDAKSTTDIVISDFGIPSITATLRKKLNQYVNAI